MTLRQQGRPVRLAKPGGDKLVIERMVAEEFVSAPFRITLDLLSENASISPKSMLREDMTVEMDTPGGVRCLNGKVARFAQVGKEMELTRYRAEVVPSLWFTTLGYDNRIFQQKSVTEIAEDVLTKAGVKTLTLKTTRGYDKREYCVQYGESNFAFVSRLLEDEGIFYLFRHSMSDHELVLGDENSVFGTCPGAGQVSFTTQAITTDGDVIHEFQRESVVHPGVITLRDYNYLEPSANLERSEGQRNEEVYRFPGGYVNRGAGGTRAKLRLDAAEALEQMVQGSGTARGLTAGGRFQLRDHWDGSANAEYALLVVRHFVSQGGWHSDGSESFTYGNQFTAVPFGVPFRPQQVTPAPRMHGTQTAVVVGKAGEEIYTDSHGRVKVQFHWDRQGKKDEKSSCWVRVSSAWAGKGWGAVNIPRIGQEVVVDFIEGDPDQPIIVGRVYNAEQVPPYALPANGTQSGLKSRSSKGGDTANFNEIRFEDKKGSEQVYVHAEKDKREVVENDNAESIGHDEAIDVGNDQKISVGRNRTETVGKDETIAIEKNRSENVGENESVNVGKNRDHSVGKNEALSVGDNRTLTIGKNESVSIGEKRETSIGKDDTLNVGKKLVITAGDEVTIKTGDASITMKKNGEITIKGKDVTVTGSGKINVKASSDVVLKGSKVSAN